jgi:hypothetical protein
MSAFPWSACENADVQSQRQAYAASLKDQVDQRQAAKQAAKNEKIAADRADDERVIREQAIYAAQAQGEINAQRQREALVARREAFAAQQAALRDGQTRADKINSYQVSNPERATQINSSIQLGDDGYDVQHTSRGQRLPSGLMPAVNRTNVVTASSTDGGIFNLGGAPQPAARPLVARIPVGDNSIFGSEPPPQQEQQQSSSQAEAQAGLARAAANAMRPDVEADKAAADTRARARGSSSLW